MNKHNSTVAICKEFRKFNVLQTNAFHHNNLTMEQQTMLT